MQNVNIYIMLSSEMLVLFSKEESNSNLFEANSALSVVTLVNRLTICELAIQAP